MEDIYILSSQHVGRKVKIDIFCNLNCLKIFENLKCPTTNIKTFWKFSGILLFSQVFSWCDVKGIFMLFTALKEKYPCFSISLFLPRSCCWCFPFLLLFSLCCVQISSVPLLFHEPVPCMKKTISPFYELVTWKGLFIPLHGLYRWVINNSTW